MLLKWFVRVKALTASDEGATAVEYGIMVAGIAVAIIVAVLAVGGQLNTVFEEVRTALTGVAP
ncbi:MAG: Flp family type IVb pilin [Coriobacteriia bacterium]|nr:Flp family type IVb pilin [Coriobacteriia bacterium]MBN2821956.1 Flp family type IVb pilin [Coriobacteriia bacterium]